MLPPTRIATPRRHILKIRRVVAARQVLWVMLAGPGHKIFRESFRQAVPRGASDSQICDAQKEAIIGENIKVRIVFRIIPNIVIEQDEGRIGRHLNRWAEDAFPTRRIATGSVIRIDMEQGVATGRRRHRIAGRPRHGIVSTTMRGGPTCRQTSRADTVKILSEDGCGYRGARWLREAQHGVSFTRVHRQRKLNDCAENKIGLKLHHERARIAGSIARGQVRIRLSRSCDLNARIRARQRSRNTSIRGCPRDPVGRVVK